MKAVTDFAIAHPEFAAFAVLELVVLLLVSIAVFRRGRRK